MRASFAPLRLVLALLVVALPIAVPASSLQVVPLRVIANPYGDIDITNTGDGPVRVSVTAYDWTQTVEDRRHIEPTDKVAYFPKIFTLAPRGVQRVRIGVADPPTAQERAYRLFVTELPPAPTTELGVAPPRLVVLTRLDLPVFVPAASDGPPVPRISGVTVNGTRVRALLRNDGPTHVQPATVSFTGLDPSGAAVWSGSADEWYVLAKSERSADATLPPGVCAKIRTFTIRWSVKPATISTTVPNPGCS